MSDNINNESSNKIKRCIIVTGMSGAGKSSALNVFEDQGYYVIDNLPPALIPPLLDVLSDNQSVKDNGLAAVVDIRGRELMSDLFDVLEHMKNKIEKIDVLFVDATDATLVKRYEMTRRTHPLSDGTTILGGIAKEREYLKDIKLKADIVIDSSELNTNDFKKKVLRFTDNADSEKLSVIVSSFGFKYGIPQDSDYMFDVRFIPNPNYVENLRHFSGKDKPIQDYLNEFECMRTFISKAVDFLSYVDSMYKNTGKKQLHIAVGCTGGRHRSVAVAETIAAMLKNPSISMVIEHRDIDKATNW